jgi:hypothetical protein
MAQPKVVNVNQGAYHATITTVEFEGKNELLIIIDLNDRRMAFPLEHYPVIREFMVMLKNSDRLKRAAWEGQHFATYTTSEDPGRAIGFRHKDRGFMLSFSAAEWQQLGNLFDKALAMPEVQDIFEQFI